MNFAPSHVVVFFEPCGFLCCVDSSGRSTAACASPCRCIYTVVLCPSMIMLCNLYGAIHLHMVFIMVFMSSSSTLSPINAIVLCIRTARLGWMHPPSDRSPTGSKHPLPFVQHNHYYCRGPLPCTSDKGNTDTCFHPRRVDVFRKVGTRLNLGGLTASSSASTLSFPPHLP